MNRVLDIACAPTNSSLAAALIGREIWITEDEGENWTRAARLPLQIETEEANREEVDFGDVVQTTKFEDDSDAATEEERVRRIEWESSLPETESSGESDESDTFATRPFVSVDDNGAWAAAVDNHLFFGGPSSGVRRRIRQPNVRGIAFDNRGFFWVATKDALILFGGGAGISGFRQRWNLAKIKAVSVGAGRAGILIPRREGLWTTSFRDGYDKPVIASNSMPEIDAAAGHPKKNEIYVVSLGRLRVVAPGTALKDLGPAPFEVEQMAVDAVGKVMLFSRGSGWVERRDGAWRPMPVISLAIDAKGRIWQGTERGPVGPLGKIRMPGIEKPPVKDFSSFLAQIESEFDREIGLPHCRSGSFFLFPRARLFFGWARGGYGHEELEITEDRVGAKQWAYFGLELTWRFSPIKAASCISCNKRRQALKEQRIRRLEALWKAWLEIRRWRPLNDNAFEAAALRLDERKVEEIIRIQSGGY